MERDLYSAVQAQDAEALERLLAAGGGPGDADRTEAVFVAVETLATPCVRVLLAHGVDPDVTRGAFDDGRDTPLLAVLRRARHASGPEADAGVAEVAEALLAAGADVNRRSGGEYSTTALLLACNAQLPRVVALLLDRGADPNLAGSDAPLAEAPLYTALTGSDDPATADAIVEQLLARGARPDQPAATWQRTPLMMAISQRAPRVVEWLLAAGADPNHRDATGVTPVALARDRGEAAILEKLAAAGAEIDPLDQAQAAFNTALRAQDWPSVLESGQALARARPEDARVYQMTSYALSRLGRHDDALAWVERGLACTYSEGLVSRLMVVLSALGRPAEIVEVWQRYKERFERDAADPHILANALAGYASLGDPAAGIADLEPWLRQNRRGDSGLLDFNAACVYALVGRIDEALRRAARALDEGWPLDSVTRDADLAPLRAHPSWAILLALRERQRRATSWRNQDGSRTTLVLDGTTLCERRYPPDDSRAGTAATISESEHATAAEGALALAVAEETLRAGGARPAASPELDFWRTELVAVVEALSRDQAEGDAPGGIGALVWEWDFGDSPAERNMWFGAFGWDDLPAARERFSTYAFADDVLWDYVSSGPPLDTPAQLEELADQLAMSPVFAALDKQTPFFLVYQEHDAGIEHSVVVGADQRAP